MNQTDDVLQVFFRECFLFDNSSYSLTFFCVAALQGMNQGQGHLAFEEIVPTLFAKRVLIGDIIQGIVHKLEGNAEIHTIRRQSFFLLRRTGAEERATATRRGKENRRFVANHFDIAFFVKLNVTGTDQLQDLALCHLRGRIGESFKNLQIPFANHDRERLCKEEVTDQHTGFIPPHSVCGILATPEDCAVDDIIMQQGCRMNKLNDTGQANMGFTLVTGKLCA